MLSGIKLVDRPDAERLAREERRQHKDKKKEQKKQQKKVCGRPQGQRWATEAVPAAAAVCVSPPPATPSILRSCHWVVCRTRSPSPARKATAPQTVAAAAAAAATRAAAAAASAAAAAAASSGTTPAAAAAAAGMTNWVLPTSAVEVIARAGVPAEVAAVGVLCGRIG